MCKANAKKTFEIYRWKGNSTYSSPYSFLHVYDNNPGVLVDWHNHDDQFQVIYIMQGEMEIFFEKGTLMVSNNSLIIIPPGVSHKLISHVNDPDEYCRQISVNIQSSTATPAMLTDILNETFDNEIFVTPLSPPQKSFRRIAMLLRNPSILNIKTFTSIMDALILEAVAIKKSNSNKKYSLANIIAENDPLNLTLMDLVEITKYSRCQLERIAKTELGTGVAEYLNKYKISEICRLLNETDMKLDDIAEAVGMYDSSHLVTFFKRHMGTTPGKFRKNL